MSDRLWKLAFLVVAFAVPADGQVVTGYERFKLFTECAPVQVIAPISGEEAEEIGLTQNRILNDGRKPPPGRAFVDQPV